MRRWAMMTGQLRNICGDDINAQTKFIAALFEMAA